MSLWRRTTEKIDALIDQRATTGREFVQNFDGLRAVAALMVFVLHLEVTSRVALGPAGVWIFFALSGHLLYLGFLRSVPVPNSTAITAYLVRRLFRILPLYFVCVLAIAYGVHDWQADYRSNWVYEHFIFVRAAAHLWTTVTELVFYLYLPFLVLLIHPVRNANWRFWILAGLGLLSWYLFEYLGLLTLRGGNPHFAPFLFGMAAVHLRNRISARTAPWLAGACLFWLFAFSSDFAWMRPIQHKLGLYQLGQLWDFGYLFYVPCALLVLAVSRSPSRIWGNRWLRLIGVCGFGFYLWHVPIIIVVREWSLPSPVFEVLCFGATSLLCILTYILIERPGIALGRRLAHWVAGDQTRRFVPRPAWICLAVIAVFMVYRFEYIIGTRVIFQFEIAASRATKVKVYLDTGRGFSEWRAGSQKVAANKWQTVTFKFRDARIDKVRIDPGETDGIYRIRNLRVSYPFFGGWQELDISALQPLARVDRAVLEGEVLSIYAQARTDDPVMIYRADLGQPWWNTRMLILVLASVSIVLVIMTAIAIDRVVARGSSAELRPQPA